MYISQPLSAKLEKLGLKSESEMWWVHVDMPMLKPKYIGQPLNINYVLVAHEDMDFKIFDEEGMGDYCPAYILSDILNPNNLKKWFGECKIEKQTHLKCSAKDVCQSFNLDAMSESKYEDRPKFCSECGSKMVEVEIEKKEHWGKWKIEGVEFVEAYWQGGIKEVEKYLEEVL